MPCLRLPVVKAKNNPISFCLWAGVGPKCTLLWHRGLQTGSWSRTMVLEWHGWEHTLCNGHHACSSGSSFIFNSHSQRNGERKRRVLHWVEVQRALFSHYDHCVAIMDNYNLTFQIFFFFFLTAPRHWSQRLFGDNPGDVCCSSWLCMLFYGNSRVLLWTHQILKLHYTCVCKTDLHYSSS